MKKERTKKTNRLISFFCIGVFCSSLVLLSFVLANVIITYQANQQLAYQMQLLEEELKYIDELGNNVQEGHYVVYSAGGYALDSDGNVVVVYEMN